MKKTKTLMEWLMKNQDKNIKSTIKYGKYLFILMKIIIKIWDLFN